MASLRDESRKVQTPCDESVANLLLSSPFFEKPVGAVDQSEWWVSLTSSKPFRGCVSVSVILRAGYSQLREDGNPQYTF